MINYNDISQLGFEDLLKRYLALANATSKNNNVADNVYSRYISSDAIKLIDLTKPITRSNYKSIEALYAQKLLASIYEHDLLFLPSNNNSLKTFINFYSEEKKIYGALLKSRLEGFLFSFLDSEIDCGGNWTSASCIEYLKSIPLSHKNTESLLVKKVLASKHPQKAVKEYVIQIAVDFLTEASALGRVILGNYGQVQSEVFKILIDEYGYGVFKTKHSSLFEATMKELNLANYPHAYWQYYLSSSLGVHNYFHYNAINYKHFFRYMGMVYAAEATFSHICKQLSGMLNCVYDKKVTTEYFDEHVEIDIFHTQMALNKIILPLIDKYGDIIIKDIVKGCESFNLIVALNDEEFIQQLEWTDEFEQDYSSNLAKCMWHTKDDIRHFIFPQKTCLSVMEGQIAVFTGIERDFIFSSGDQVFIPPYRHFMLLADKESNWTIEYVS